MTLRGFQQLIRDIYFDKDNGRGLESTFMWFVEEVGELADSLRSGAPEELEAEFADVAAWLATLASIAGVDLERAVRKYAAGCPKCGHTPCRCQEPAPPGGPERR